MRKDRIRYGNDKSKPGDRGTRGFTLIEMLVVIAVIAVLSGIIVPVATKARAKVREAINVSNKRQIVMGVTAFATDNDDRFPRSVARLAPLNSQWNWWDPRTLIAKYPYEFGPHRAVSEYLGTYIPDGRVMYCPNTPGKFKYAEQSWVDGDGWDIRSVDPEVDPLPRPDHVIGSYMLLWNYEGYLGPGRIFKGPGTLTRRHGESRLLTCDSIFSSNYRMYEPYGTMSFSSTTEHIEGNYGSCEKFSRASATNSSKYEADYWYKSGQMPLIEAHAGYTDGSVQSFTTKDVVGMRVIIDPETNEPYPESLDALGTFYLPQKDL